MAWDFLLTPSLDLPKGGGRAVVRQVGDDDLLKQHLLTRAATWRGTWILQRNYGIPYRAMLGQKPFDLDFAKAAFSDQFSRVTDVSRVTSITVELLGDEAVVSAEVRGKTGRTVEVTIPVDPRPTTNPTGQLLWTIPTGR